MTAGNRQAGGVRSISNGGGRFVRLPAAFSRRVREGGGVPKRMQDRRVQRTRQLLQDALVSLMVEKGYEDTTVQDIIDRANVGRATFYAHFADKDTLLASRLEDLRELLVRRQREVLEASGDAKGRGFGFSLALLEHARSHLTLYRAIVGRKSGSVVVQRIQGMVADLVRGELAARERGGAGRGAAAAGQWDLAVQIGRASGRERV